MQRAPFAPEEARPYRALRKWAAQFYGPEGLSLAEDGPDLALVAE